VSERLKKHVNNEGFSLGMRTPNQKLKVCSKRFENYANN